MIRVFRIRGWFKQGDRCQKFTREFPALSEKQVLERVYSELGSKHRVKRNLIHIEEIMEVKTKETVT